MVVVIKNLVVPDGLEDGQKRGSNAGVSSTAKKVLPKAQPSSSVDADLQSLIDAWQTLPDKTKQKLLRFAGIR